MDDKGLLNIPRKVFSPTQMTKHERKMVESKLRLEIEQIQSFRKAPIHKTEARNDILLPSPEAHRSRPNLDNLKFSDIRNTGRSIRSSSQKMARRTTPISKSYAVLMKECRILLTGLLQQSDAWIFDEPVDPVKLRIPNYFDIIQHPMDLGTIRDKIDTNRYSSPWEFAEDVRLTFSNAMKFNPPGHYVNSLAFSFCELFESGWKHIEKKLDVVDSIANRENGRKMSGVQSEEWKASRVSNSITQSVKQRQNVSLNEKRSLLHFVLRMKQMPKSISNLLECHKIITEINGKTHVHLSRLDDGVFFEMKKILDTSSTGKEPGQHANPESNKSKNSNGSGVSNLSIHPCQGNELTDEEVDIIGDETPTSTKAQHSTDRDASSGSEKPRSSSSSSSSSSDSNSSSSDSSSGSSSESESDDDDVTSTKDTEERETNSKAPSQDTSKLDIFYKNSSHEQKVCSDFQSVNAMENGEDNIPNKSQCSLQKLPRAITRRIHFDDITLKVCENTLDQKG